MSYEEILEEMKKKSGYSKWKLENLNYEDLNAHYDITLKKIYDKICERDEKIDLILKNKK